MSLHPLFFVCALLLFSGCDLTTLAENKPDKIEAQAGPYGWYYIDELVGTACDRYKSCEEITNFNACTAELLSSLHLPDALGAGRERFPTTYDLREGERKGELRVQFRPAEDCLMAFEEASCAAIASERETDPSLEQLTIQILNSEPSCLGVYL